MLVQRIEENSRHIFFNSPIGISDWISRTGSKYEIQVTSAYQNYGYLAQMDANYPIEICSSTDIHDYKEKKDSQLIERKTHKLKGLFTIIAEKDTIITFKRHVLGSMRAIRILQEGGQDEYESFALKEKITFPESCISGQSLVIKRSFGEALFYTAELSCPSVIWEKNAEEIISLSLREGSHKLTVETSITGRWEDEDLSPFSDNEISLLNEKAQVLFNNCSAEKQQTFRNQLQSLLLLSRKTKLLAGGPRFFTYFGRDSLISIALLSGVVITDLSLEGIRSVLQRISPKGEVAHEETPGEFSALLNRNSQEQIVKGPLLEYNMVDDDFLLPAVIKHWMEIEDALLMQEMLELPLKNGITGYALLAKNLRYCICRLKEDLIPFHQDMPVGDWRDSLAEQNIRYSYELNTGLVPYFLEVYSYLLKNLPKLKQADKSLPDPKELVSVHRVFVEKTAAFKVEIDVQKRREEILNWLKSMDFSEKEFSVLKNRLNNSLKNHSLYPFYGLGLRGDHSVLKIQHNDTAFNLLFGSPNAEEISLMLIPFETCFPLGLKTDAGILVSNPVFCDDQKVRYEMNRSHYHGLVIWPLMHNILYHGLKIQTELYRQPEFQDLRSRMFNMMEYLKGLDSVLQDFSSSELWTFSPRKTGDLPLAFGSGSGSKTESNPVQLWSSLGFTRSLF